MDSVMEAEPQTDGTDEGDSVFIVTKKFAFQALLEKAATVVPSKNFQPVLHNFLIEAETGKIRVAATNLELSIVATGQLVVVEKPGTCVLPAAKMLSIVREAEDGDLNIEVEKGMAKITVGNTAWNLRVADSGEFPPMPVEGEIEFSTVSAEELLAALSAVRYAVCKDSLKPGFMMVDISKGRVRASDMVRFQQVKAPEGMPDMQIPGGAVEDLIKMLRSTSVPKIEVGQDEYQLVFRVGMDVFIASRLQAVFPDVDEIIAQPAMSNDQALTVSRSDLIAAIRRVRVAADEDTSAVKLFMDKDGVLVCAADKYGSTATTAIDGEWKHDDRIAAFNWAYLMEMLQQGDDKSVTLKFGKDAPNKPSPVIVRSGDDGSYGVLHQIYAGKG